MFFAGQLTEHLSTISLSFLAFSLTASTIYIFNDIKDVNYDKNGSKKNLFASKSISIKSGYWIAGVLLITGLTLGAYSGNYIVLVAYIIINIFYTIKLKTIPYLELFCIVSGFMLRIYYGGITTNIDITSWLYTETFILTLLIILSKRIKELIQFQKHKRLAREVIQYYNIRTLHILFIFLNILILFIYAFYCLDQSVIDRTNKNIWITIPLVFAGLYRFIYTTLNNKNHASPINNLFQDKLLMIIISLWLVTWFYLIY